MFRPRLRPMNPGLLSLGVPLAVAVAFVAAAPAGAATRSSPAVAQARTALQRSHASVGASAAIVGAAPALDIATARALPPASTLKLFTVGTALTLLGPSHVFLTKVVATAAPDATGTVHGDLVLVAGGDPTLTRDDLGLIAQAVAADGVHHVTGSLRIDDTLFDTVRGGLGWKAGYVGTESGPLSALTLDDNFWGKGKAYLADPIPADLALFRLQLSHRKVSVAGPSKTGPSPSPVVTEITEHQSAPLSVIAGEVLRPSDNTEAEVLLKDDGVAASGVGSSAAGVAAVRATAAQLGVAPPTVMADGSGLSTRDRVTATQLVNWLSRIAATPAGHALIAGLPVSCRSGTLSDRLCSVKGHVTAKTGSLDATAALAGFATTRSGRTIVFAMVVSGRPWSTDSSAIDSAVTALVKGL